MQPASGIYIHIPFCARKCTYCNFNTTDFDNGIASKYSQALVREIRFWGDRLSRTSSQQEKLQVDTIYFGGGTPSIIEAEFIDQMIVACQESFNVDPAAEITIEINPSTVGADSSLSTRKLRQWRASGINRASVGVQSFIDAELVSLSRTHTTRDAIETVQALRESDFDNISLDLIAGLPEQSLSKWDFNLGEALKLAPEHLSLYLLEVKEGTQLFAQIKRGLREEPDDDLAAEMFRMICRRTADAGYVHYEISNFAKSAASLGTAKCSLPVFFSKHNLKYWNGSSFYGFGCGAHSYDGQSRWVNLLQTQSYIDALSTGEAPIGEYRTLTDDERASEALFMALRLAEGVDLADFGNRYGIDVMSRYGVEVERLAEAGLITIDGQRLSLTEKGMLLSNEVFIAFV